MAKGASINLDSFLDIMTCLVGVLVLILILTSLDAGQIKVLIQTPMEKETSKQRVTLECANNQLYFIDLPGLRRKVQEALDSEAPKYIAESRDRTVGLMKAYQNIEVQDDFYRVILAFSMLDQMGIQLRDGVEGYAIKSYDGEKSSDWYGKILTSMDPKTQILSFKVRDDSYPMFKLARALAWNAKIDVMYELLDINDPLRFPLGGMMSVDPGAPRTDTEEEPAPAEPAPEPAAG
ncbi:MAG: hypothetical protein EOM20_14350 [Spartobacteria bacterium]|nr:hypothetical protein [Spartobacteria bacterium]